MPTKWTLIFASLWVIHIFHISDWEHTDYQVSKPLNSVTPVCIWVSTTDYSYHCERDYKRLCIAVTFPQTHVSTSTLLPLLAQPEYLLEHNNSFHHFEGISGALFFFFYFYSFCPVSLTFSPHPSSASTPAFLTLHRISPYYLPNISSALLIASSVKRFGRLLHFLLISL